MGDLLVGGAVAFGLVVGRGGGGFAADETFIDRGGVRDRVLEGAFIIRIGIVRVVGVMVVWISIMRGFLQFSTYEINPLTIDLLMIGIHKYSFFLNLLTHPITGLSRMMMRMMILLKSCSLHYFLILLS